MAVQVTTWKLFNEYYNHICYTGVLQGSNQVIYDGYYNALNPYDISLAEWEALTGTHYSEDSVTGDANGFSATTYRTKSHIIFSGTNPNNNVSYKLAMCVRRDTSSREEYDLKFYHWLSTSPTTWYLGAGISFGRDSTLSPVSTAYVKQPEHIYLLKDKTGGGGTWYIPSFPAGYRFYGDTRFTYYTGPYIETTNEAPDPQPTPPVDPDPYNPGGGNTEPGGGEGNPIDTNTPVDIPTLPTVGGGEGVADSGLISLFNPTITQIRNLASYMWNSSLFDLSTWQKLFADPMDAIISLSIVPIEVPSTNSRVLKVGNISTGITLNVASKQFIEHECGSLNIQEYWGAYLDYDPYTKFEIYLPYIGTKEISADDIMGRTIVLKYHIDILSGACVAYLKCGDTVLYNWTGHCAMQIPLSGTDMGEMVGGILSILGTYATGGAGAAAGFHVASATDARNAANLVNNVKPKIERSGTMGSAAGILGIQVPYLIITRPKQALPFNQNHFTGYPSFINETLGNLTGYTIVEEIHLAGVPATSLELLEIEELLKKGVII